MLEPPVPVLINWQNHEHRSSSIDFELADARSLELRNASVSTGDDDGICGKSNESISRDDEAVEPQTKLETRVRYVASRRIVGKKFAASPMPLLRSNIQLSLSNYRLICRQIFCVEKRCLRVEV